ncbi:MAG: hypothetical protein GXY42_12345, partial [Desulfovibrionales bacterium]|nr:hypothetical protein [Desulfovibrionales bacterium]
MTIVGADDPTFFDGTTTGSVSEDGVLTATDMLTATDRDAGDTAIMAQSNTVGAYGTFNISINGIWNYALNNSAANVQALNAGQTVTDTFAVATAGGVTRNVVISIAGANEEVVNTPPSLAVPSHPTFTDTSADDIFIQANGILVGSDPDPGTTLVYGLSGGTISGGSVSKVGTYGTLTVNTATGAWTYTPDDAAIKALETNSTDPFTVTVSDGQASASQSFNVSIIGSVEDLPPVLGTNGNDTATVGRGNAHVALGAGQDTAVLPMFPDVYSLVQEAPGRIRGTCADYTLTLEDVEFVQFGTYFQTTLAVGDLASGQAKLQLGRLTD